MTLVVADRIQETTATTGTGTLTLAGAVSGFRAFSVIGDGNSCFYVIDDGAGNWEVGRGTYTSSGTTLSRDWCSPAATAGAWSASGPGTKNVWVDAPAMLLTQAALAVANVKLYGAAGNGSTDDHAAIQAAINSGLPVYFPAGTYAISDGPDGWQQRPIIDRPQGRGPQEDGGGGRPHGHGQQQPGPRPDHRRQQPGGGSGLVINGRGQLLDGVESHHNYPARHLPGRPESRPASSTRFTPATPTTTAQIGISQNHVYDSMISDCHSYHNGYEGITIDNQSYRCLIANCNLNANCQSGGVGGIGIDEGDLARISNCIIQGTASGLPWHQVPEQSRLDGRREHHGLRAGRQRRTRHLDVQQRR